MLVEKILFDIKPSDRSLRLEGYLLFGKLLEKKSQYTEAIEQFNNYLKIEAEGNKDIPPKANTFFLIGDCYEKLKDIKKSVLNFKKCLTLDNRHFNSCIHLANLLANVGEGQRAAKYFKHAIKIDPESVNAHFGLGKALQ
jgi:tetratricopeptide (TPR) repeat protein